MMSTDRLARPDLRSRHLPGLRWTALLVGALALCGPVHAGLYTTAETVPAPQVRPTGVRPVPANLFRATLAQLRALRQPQPRDRELARLRASYVRRRDELLGRKEPLTVAEQVNLSADLIRLGQYEEAIRLLSWADRGERPRFLLLGNLGTANQLAGNLDRARSALEQLQDAWPEQWPGLSKAQLAWYRTVERYHLKLVRLRWREAQRLRGDRPLDQVDALFGPIDAPVRFLGESGKYEAGRIAATEQKKLPADAVAVVQQLLIWLPDDTRLYWLLGELLNAQGDVTDAAAVLDDCVLLPRGRSPDLVAHRRLLKEARPAEAAVELLPPSTPAPAPPAGWAPRTGQLVLVGTLAGLVVLLLGYLQVRELRRRRRQRQPSP